MLSEKEIKILSQRAGNCLASFNVLFQSAVNGVYEPYQLTSSAFLAKLHSSIISLCKDLTQLEKDPSSSARISSVLSAEPDSVDTLNSLSAHIHSTAQGFQHNMENTLLEALSSKSNYVQDAASFSFLASHAVRLAAEFPQLADGYAKLLNSELPPGTLSRINPDLSTLTEEPSLFKTENGILNPSTISSIEEQARKADPFHGGHAFRYIDGHFHVTTLSSIRKVSDFYGYPAARRQFKTHFENFAKGLSNLPLLITSLPGLGKTHFSIAHVLLFPNLTLILPEPSDLEKPFEGLIKSLARRKDHRFVIFFDDIDTRKVDWYYFRTHVGGSFVLPENVTLVIASNYEFPANISSRGRGFVFPIFDEIACQEMVSDFLVSLGMKNPPPELISVIAADYVEEFGQKMFEELSPRTLVRYLDRYDKDMVKRKRMLDMSRGEIITRPDSQMFFDVNIKLMRALYGEDAINEIRNRQLGGR